MKKIIPTIRYNHYIEAINGIIKVINEAGEFIGEMSIKEAMNIAFSQDLDLVQISYESIPVCKICDYNKYKYSISQKNKQKSQNNKPVQVKTIKLGINIEASHLELKVKKAKELLEEGDKVCFSARLKGREMSQIDIAMEFFDNIIKQFQGQWTIDKVPSQMGREVSCVIGKKVANNNNNNNGKNDIIETNELEQGRGKN